MKLSKSDKYGYSAVALFTISIIIASRNIYISAFALICGFVLFKMLIDAGDDEREGVKDE